MKKHTIIIVGKGGSGKSFLSQRLINSNGRSLDLEVTTRPPRQGEKFGIDYLFHTEENFRAFKEKDLLWDIRSYKINETTTWYYARVKETLAYNDLFLMTPHSINHLDPSFRKKALVIFLDIDESTLIKRLSQRQDIDSVMRRIESDRRDFENFTDYDIRITNSDF